MKKLTLNSNGWPIETKEQQIEILKHNIAFLEKNPKKQPRSGYIVQLQMSLAELEK